MNDIRSVDFSDAQIKSLLFEVYSAGFEAGYPRCTDIHTGFNTWYRDVIQKDNLPVYAHLTVMTRTCWMQSIAYAVSKQSCIQATMNASDRSLNLQKKY